MAMGILTMLAVIGMASAIYVARSTHGEAGAVNMAGSLTESPPPWKGGTEAVWIW